MLKYSLVIILLGFFLVSFTTNDSTTNKKIAVHEDKIDLSEAAAYKLLYENQKESNSKILNTIYWALSAIGTALFAVYGSTWWFNSKKVTDILDQNESRINNIEQNIRAEIKEDVAEIVDVELQIIRKKNDGIYEAAIDRMGEINTDFQNLKDKLNVEIKNDFSEIRKEIKTESNNYQNLLNSHNNNLSNTIHLFKESVSKELSSIRKDLTVKIRTLQNNSTLLEYKLKRIDLKQTYELAMTNKQYKLALQELTRKLILEHRMNYEWAYEYTLSKIINCIVNTNNSIFKGTEERLDQIIRLFDEKYPNEINKIKEFRKSAEII